MRVHVITYFLSLVGWAEACGLRGDEGGGVGLPLTLRRVTRDA
jgi:hypothetical protein